MALSAAHGAADGAFLMDGKSAPGCRRLQSPLEPKADLLQCPVFGLVQLTAFDPLRTLVVCSGRPDEVRRSIPQARA